MSMYALAINRDVLKHWTKLNGSLRQRHHMTYLTVCDVHYTWIRDRVAPRIWRSKGRERTVRTTSKEKEWNKTGKRNSALYQRWRRKYLRNKLEFSGVWYNNFFCSLLFVGVFCFVKILCKCDSCLWELILLGYFYSYTANLY